MFCLCADQSLVVDRDLEVQLEVRPLTDTGLLLHAGTSPDQRLSLMLNQGEVRAEYIQEVQKTILMRITCVCVCGHRWYFR